MNRKRNRLMWMVGGLIGGALALTVASSVIAQEAEHPAPTETETKAARARESRREERVAPTAPAKELVGGIEEVLARIRQTLEEHVSPPSADEWAELRAQGKDALERLQRGVERLRRVARARREYRPDRDGRRFAVLELEHANAPDVADAMREFLPPDSRIVPDPRTNRILLLTTDAGLDIAREIREALDVPAREPERAANDRELQGRRTAPRRYDYEPSAEQPTPERPFRPKPLERTTGKIVEKGDDYLVIRPKGEETPVTFRLPSERSETGEWEVRPELRKKLAGYDVGSEVAVDWWSGEGERYVERLGSARRTTERGETYLFGR